MSSPRLRPAVRILERPIGPWPEELAKLTSAGCNAVSARRARDVRGHAENLVRQGGDSHFTCGSFASRRKTEGLKRREEVRVPERRVAARSARRWVGRSARALRSAERAATRPRRPRARRRRRSKTDSALHVRPPLGRALACGARRRGCGRFARRPRPRTRRAERPRGWGASPAARRRRPTRAGTTPPAQRSTRWNVGEHGAWPCAQCTAGTATHSGRAIASRVKIRASHAASRPTPPSSAEARVRCHDKPRKNAPGTAVRPP